MRPAEAWRSCADRVRPRARVCAALRPDDPGGGLCIRLIQIRADRLVAFGWRSLIRQAPFRIRDTPDRDAAPGPDALRRRPDAGAMRFSPPFPQARAAPGCDRRR